MGIIIGPIMLEYIMGFIIYSMMNWALALVLASRAAARASLRVHMVNLRVMLPIVRRVCADVSGSYSVLTYGHFYKFANPATLRPCKRASLTLRTATPV